MSDPLLVEVAESIFAKACTEQERLVAEHSGWAPDAWNIVADAGLPWISVPESAGGQGGSLGDALAVLQVAGRHAVPLPLAETGMLGGWLLSAAGATVGDGPITVVPARSEDSVSWDGRRVTGVVHRVPWARTAERVVLLVPQGDGWSVAVLARARVRVDEQANLAGEPRDTVYMDQVVPIEVHPAPAGVDPDTLAVRGALSRVTLMAGAVERVLEITLRYTGERKQFGRAIGEFQAVQQHLVHLAQQAAVAAMAAEIAGREVERGGGRFEVSAAKTVADDVARIATRAAHQAHGAMGATREYPLHHLTRRLWAWSREYGDGARWAREIGDEVVAGGPDRLWPLITGGSAAARMP
ncbi:MULTISPECIES: acyl-CoA dehydrogenase family protein [Nocardia]|uniref:acyl-CoA dehydrogenase family protein n=1 Tax=Nocardia TaxID=1817 RepID=UPI000D68794C|nr:MULTISPECIES: acyl-CoA dehydrogenase family protein [Nocardia]